MSVGVYPGSFDPLTTAHVAIAEAAIARFGLERLDLVLSRVALAKEDRAQASLARRVAAIERAASSRPQLGAVVTDSQLLADIAAGYDVCVLGADKWHQLHDLAFYRGSLAERDAALARLPTLAVAPRAGVPLPAPGDGLVVLEIDPSFHGVSSTAVREGRHDWRA
jgi:cytidylyltransferase-like protein